MLPRDYIINQINHVETDIVPYALGFEDPMIEKLNEYFGNTDWINKIKKFIVPVASADTRLLKPIDSKFSVDGYGCVWRMDKKLWHIDKTPLENAELTGYTFPSSSTFTDPIYENLEKFNQNCKENSDKFKVVDMGWGIFERTWMMRGFENALMDALCEPDFYEELLGRITDIYVDMVNACKDIDADAIFFGDDWGDQRGIILGPDTWRKFIKPCWKRVYDEVHKQNKFVISHSCGSIHDVLDDAIEIGLNVYESVQPEPEKMNPYELKKKFGDRITFLGCLGTQSIIPHGTPSEIKNEIIKLCTEVGKGGGYILAPSKPLQEDTPLENALAIIDTFVNKTV